jgi:hypothetical protein
MIEGVREIGERRDVLKADDADRVCVDGDEKDTACGKLRMNSRFLFDGERRIEGGRTVAAMIGLRIAHHVLGVLDTRVSNRNHVLQEIKRLREFFSKDLLSQSLSSSLRQRIRPDLEVHHLARRPLPVSMWNGVRVLMVAHSPCPSSPSRVVNASVHPLRVEARWIGHAHHDPVAVFQREQRLEALPVLIGVFAPRPDVSN